MQFIEKKNEENNLQIEEHELVSFKLGNEEFATSIKWVNQIIRYQQVTPVPNTPSFVEGVINLRGKVIPVIDLRKRLGNAKQNIEKKTRILNIEMDNKIIGFLVDEVTGVLSVAANLIDKTPDVVVAGVESDYISGVCKLDERLIILLDFTKILFSSEKAQALALTK
jgi:purine-binding chemotaxis protein CheW